jgi:hypothetical protein
MDEPEPVRMSAARRKRLAELQAATGIDFGRYYKPGLLERIAGLFDALSYVPLCARWVATTLVVAGIYWLWLFGWRSPWAWVPALFWTLAGGLLVGALLAIRGVVRRGLEHVGEVFDVSLELVASALDDCASLQAARKPPEWKDVLEGILIAAVAPSMGAAFRARLPLLGRPVAWVLDRTLLGLAAKVNAEIEQAEPAGADTPRSATLEALQARAARTRAIVGSIGSGAVQAASLPLTALVVIAMLAFALPMALVSWML